MNSDWNQCYSNQSGKLKTCEARQTDYDQYKFTGLQDNLDHRAASDLPGSRAAPGPWAAQEGVAPWAGTALRGDLDLQAPLAGLEALEGPARPADPALPADPGRLGQPAQVDDPAAVASPELQARLDQRVSVVDRSWLLEQGLNQLLIYKVDTGSKAFTMQLLECAQFDDAMSRIPTWNN